MCMCGNAHHQDERAEARVYGATMLAALAAADAPPATAAAVCAAGLPAALSRLLTGPCPPRVRAAVVMCLRRLSLFSACRVRFRGTIPQPNPTQPTLTLTLRLGLTLTLTRRIQGSDGDAFALWLYTLSLVLALPEVSSQFHSLTRLHEAEAAVYDGAGVKARS